MELDWLGRTQEPRTSPLDCGITPFHIPFCSRHRLSGGTAITFTMLLPGILSGRQAIGWLRSTQYLANCRSTPSFNLGRVGVLYSLPSPIARCYATDRPVSRPKAHTGRSTSTRKPKAPAAPKKATKTAAKKVTKTVKKPAAKKTVKKPKAKTKTKAKPKTKKRVRKVLTEKQKAEVVTKKKRSDLQALKELALKPPHSKPATAYLVFHQEHSKGQSGLVSTLTKAAAMGYRNLSTERREVCIIEVILCCIR